MKVACAEYISFYTTFTNPNGSPAVDLARIEVATHVMVANYEANLKLKLTLIRPHTTEALALRLQVQLT